MPISFSSPGDRDLRARGHGVTAVLGPTNTGKTHLAIERMLAHSSGLIGLPLRLLAREVYNKIAERVGADAVALITGEEKIKPAHPRFWVSTVEAMPRGLDVADGEADLTRRKAQRRHHAITRDHRGAVVQIRRESRIGNRAEESSLDLPGDTSLDRQPLELILLADRGVEARELRRVGKGSHAVDHARAARG